MTPEEVVKHFGGKKLPPAPKPIPPEEIARLMGARIVGKVPEIGGGAIGAAYHAHVYRQRMAELRADFARHGYDLSEETVRTLAEMAAEASTPRRPVTPQQIAMQIIEKAVRKHREAS